jgi:hypothetical protein
MKKQKMSNTLFMTALICVGLSFASCSSDDAVPTTKKANVWDNLEFTSKTPYFSTDGNMTVPVNAAAAKPIVGTIDISYIYNYDYSKAGFFDPYTRSQEWYWDEYEEQWLSNAVKTNLYSTQLSQSDFDAAKNDVSKIGTYFSDTSAVKLAAHGIFPLGTCVGGRSSSEPGEVALQTGGVYGFKNISTGKRGLLFVHQIESFVIETTIVSILKE